MEKDEEIEVDPAVEARVQKGQDMCKFRDGKCEKSKDCPHKHVMDTSRSGTPKKKGKGKGNGGTSASPSR